MKKIKLIQSLRDLAAIEAKDICAEDKPYFRRFVDAYEKKLLDDIVQKAIDRANMMRVLPVLYRFFDNNMDIPIPFDLDEEPVNQIMTIMTPSTSTSGPPSTENYGIKWRTAISFVFTRPLIRLAILTILSSAVGR